MVSKGLDLSILKKSATEVLVEAIFQSDYPYFDGHFDGFQLLPALLQIHVVVELSKEHFESMKNPTIIPSMKFINPIYPKTKVLITITFDSIKNQIKFRYSAGEFTFSQGTLR